MTASLQDLIDFWFSLPEEKWFQKDDAFDLDLRNRFEDLLQQNARATPPQPDARSLLGLVLLFDQIPRNIYRGRPESFLFDEKALRLSKQAVERGLDAEFSYVERSFLYLPFEHSEKIEDQNKAVELFTRLVAESEVDGESRFESQLDYARRHRDVISQFGRFPHRNAILSRQSTQQEAQFLTQPNSSF